MDIKLARAAHTVLTHHNRLPADGPDARLSRTDLFDTFMFGNEPPDLASAAFTLHLPGNFQKLDTAAGIGPADGYVGRQDLIAAASQRLSYQEAVEIVAQHGPELDTAAGLGRPDGRFGREDLAAVVQGDRDPALQEAAWFFLSHPQEYRVLENAARLGMPDDGYIGWQDVQSALRAPLADFS